MIYELKKQLENCTHGKFNHIIDGEHVNCDLGIYEDVTNEDGVTSEFVPKYTSAVVRKDNLVDYSEGKLQ